ncbi:hypothetical protein FGO68_gene12319 [Halteria grandinella]|uniref:Uncharacterized protein n=1 Tax=Halteria grandinella TaxID=5974 RepID=A0A8J8T7C4_HALGN|nr:hypothetical protein FGO68_gene12319 [Halteria grandinella]
MNDNNSDLDDDGQPSPTSPRSEFTVNFGDISRGSIDQDREEEIIRRMDEIERQEEDQKYEDEEIKEVDVQEGNQERQPLNLQSTICYPEVNTRECSIDGVQNSFSEHNNSSMFEEPNFHANSLDQTFARDVNLQQDNYDYQQLANYQLVIQELLSESQRRNNMYQPSPNLLNLLPIDNLLNQLLQNGALGGRALAGQGVPPNYQFAPIAEQFNYCDVLNQQLDHENKLTLDKLEPKLRDDNSNPAELNQDRAQDFQQCDEELKEDENIQTLEISSMSPQLQTAQEEEFQLEINQKYRNQTLSNKGAQLIIYYEGNQDSEQQDINIEERKEYYGDVKNSLNEAIPSHYDLDEIQSSSSVAQLSQNRVKSDNLGVEMIQDDQSDSFEQLGDDQQLDEMKAEFEQDEYKNNNNELAQTHEEDSPLLQSESPSQTILNRIEINPGNNINSQPSILQQYDHDALNTKLLNENNQNDLQAEANQQNNVITVHPHSDSFSEQQHQEIEIINKIEADWHALFEEQKTEVNRPVLTAQSSMQKRLQSQKINIDDGDVQGGGSQRNANESAAEQNLKLHSIAVIQQAKINFTNMDNIENPARLVAIGMPGQSPMDNSAASNLNAVLSTNDASNQAAAINSFSDVVDNANPEISNFAKMNVLKGDDPSANF